ncbi:MAG TPA: hypothetical protein VMB21_18680 [Candidatus Limnocylindria bacterium]|nr:hypothetical protein [Candidatus Limnocylindria bacterium]
MSRTVKFAAALLLSLTLGLHWAMLQSVAWTSMLVQRTQTSSFTAALKSTFDGHHPCKLCQIVRDGKGAEKKSEATLKLVKLEASAPSETPLFVLPARPVSRLLPSPADWIARAEVPPVPPPRA